jgi:hypothetical protein
MKFVTDLDSAVVVERGPLSELKADAMAQALADIYARGKPVMIVDSAQKFFSARHLVSVLDDPSKSDLLPVLLEKRGISLDEADQLAIFSYHRFKQKLIESIASSKENYQFAAVPDGWDLKDRILFQSKTIRRADGSHTIGYRALRQLWDAASKYWAGIVDQPESPYVRAGGYNRLGEIKRDKIVIGCQSIQRFELEQAALHLEWDFPKEEI